jgi:hypothetical protein
VLWWWLEMMRAVAVRDKCQGMLNKAKLPGTEM